MLSIFKAKRKVGATISALRATEPGPELGDGIVYLSRKDHPLPPQLVFARFHHCEALDFKLSLSDNP